MSSASYHSTHALLNVAVVLLLACVALLLVLRNLNSAIVAAENTDPPSYTTSGRDQLPDDFIWTGVVSRVPAEGETMSCLLVGQTDRFEIVLDAAGLQCSVATGQTKQRTKRRENWRHPLQKGDRIDLVKHRDGIGAYHNGARVAQVYCPVQTWQRGLWQVPADASPFLVLDLQAIGPVHFSDDFMHPPGEFGGWQPLSGEWTIHTLDNPVRSANAFSLAGKGDEAVIRAGQWFWRNYTLSTSVLPAKNSGFGVRFCAGDSGHYQLDVQPEGEDGESLIRLLRASNGLSSTLAEEKAPLSPAVWYRLQISQLDGRMVVAVDNHVLLRATDPHPLLGGGIALAASGEGTVFDDVRATPTQSVGAAFGAEAPARQRSGRLISVSSEATANESGLQIPPPGGRIDLRGVVLDDATISCDFAPGPSNAGRSTATLRAREVGRNWIGLRIRKDRDGTVGSLVVCENGKERTIGEGAPPEPANQGRFALVLRGRSAHALYNGVPFVSTGQCPLPLRGSASIRVETDAPAVRVRAVELAPTIESASIQNRVETFEHERSMSNWSSPASEWNSAAASFDTVYWHRTDFWSNASVSVQSSALREADASVADAPFGLVFGAGTTAGSAMLRLAATPGSGEDSPPWTARLFVGDEERDTAPLSGFPSTLRLERFHDRLQAYVDGRLLWNRPLPKQLGGLCRVGRFGRGGEETWAGAVSVRASNVLTYPFKSAPVDWVPETGDWKVTNRWECDPRWSFFSGVRLDGTACLWHKYRFPSNVTLEFFAGPKMDRSRGSHYQYAADLNAVIGADGIDIDSGYSFLFGGWDDEGSYMVRRRDVLAEDASMVIPRKGSTHRRWFYIKVRKQDDTLTYWVENKKIAEVADDRPLDGNRLGLWTYKNGMMVAYVRLCADRILPPADVVHLDARNPSTPYADD